MKRGSCHPPAGRLLERVCTTGAGLLLPGLAVAQTPQAAAVSTANLIALAAIGIAILTVLFGLRARRRARQALAAHAESERELDRFLAATEGVGGGFFLFRRQTGTQAHSPNLPALMGDPEHELLRFTDLRAMLEPADSRRLNAAVGKLHDNGERFTIKVRRLAGGRDLRITGFRVRDAASKDSGSGEADVLWLHDDPESAADAARLEQERDNLRALLDGLPLPVWLRDDELAIADVNKPYVRAVEAGSAAEVVDRGLEFAGSVIADQGRALADFARRSGLPESEQHHIVVDGSRRLMDVTEFALMNGHTGGFALDRTEVEEAESELARHLAAHAEVLELLATAIAIFDPGRKMRFFNSAYVKLWNLEESWLHGEPRMEELLELLRERRLLPETADFPAFKRSWLRLFTTLIEPMEELLHLPDGRTLRMVIAPHPMGGILQTFEDVTDRLALERSYNTLIDVQRETLNNLAEAVAVFGSDGRLKLYNPPLAEIWSLPESLLASEPHVGEIFDHIKDLLPHGGDWDRFKAALIARFSRRRVRTGEMERTDGRVLQYRFLPLPDGGVLVKSLDITDTNRVERALRERGEALEAADRLKSEFIANVSYELRTPLNTIMGFVEILNNQYFGPLNQRQQEYSRGILESSQELLSLINDILDLATIEAGRMTLHIEAVNIRTMFENISALVRERAKHKQLQVKIDCPANLRPIQMDERRMKHAFLNLLHNAIEYTNPGGEIALGARLEDDEIALSVADTGVGIPDDEQSRIFDMFVRGRTQIGRGHRAGLGLSLVKSFIDLHGGRIEIDSRVNAGTKVTCILPVHRQGGRAALTADLLAATNPENV